MSAPIAYPFSLPGPVSASAQSAERRLLSPADGPSTARTFQRDRLDTQPLSFLFTATEMAIFMAWWRDALLRGGAWFSAIWPHPLGYVELVRKFVGMPARKVLGNGLWSVDATFEVRGVGVQPLDYGRDEHWDQVVLLARLTGADGSTVFEDLTGRHTLAAVGNAHVATGLAVLGESTSLLLDGSGDYVSVAGNLGDFAFPGVPYTLEIFAESVAGALGALMGTNGWEWTMPSTSSVYLNAAFSASGDFHVTGASPALAPGAFHHIGFSYDGANACNVHLDGKFYPGVKAANPSFGADASVRIGANGISGFPYYWDGRLQEVRCTRGVARYPAADITPPSRHFPTRS